MVRINDLNQIIGFYRRLKFDWATESGFYQEYKARLISERTALEQMPPELAADLIDYGITLAGGGALLKNLDVPLRSETRLPIKIAADPLSAVAVGAGEALSNLTILRNLEK